MRQKTGPLLEPQNPGRTALSPLGKRRNFHEKSNNDRHAGLSLLR